MSIYIDVKWAGLSKYGEELCGDNVEVVRTPDFVMAVLADGLGSGVKANILSTMTVKIVSTMFKNGASLEEVVETISQTLPVCKKRNLAYSTFTIIQISRQGHAYVVEFDNPSVFVLRDGEILPIPWQERELFDRKIKESRFQAYPGDLLVTVSDGVIHAGIGGVLNLGWGRKEVSEYIEGLEKLRPDAQTLSKQIISTCNELYAEHPGDDATALVFRLRSPRTLTLAVGPPLSKEDDAIIAQMIKDEPGGKVVCGGTTSTIIARELGCPVSLDLEVLDPEVPPYGHMKGIGLVTEGIITLSKVLERLKSRKDSLASSYRHNAVAILTRILLESDRIRFLIGKAINPAHQNPDLPLNLALKMQVVREIAETLEKDGKQVELLYF